MVPSLRPTKLDKLPATNGGNARTSEDPVGPNLGGDQSADEYDQTQQTNKRARCEPGPTAWIPDRSVAIPGISSKIGEHVTRMFRHDSPSNHHWSETNERNGECFTQWDLMP